MCPSTKVTIGVRLAAATALVFGLSLSTHQGYGQVRSACNSGPADGPDVAVLSYCMTQSLELLDFGDDGVRGGPVWGIGDTLCGDGRFHSVTIVEADVVRPSAADLAEGYSCAVVMTGLPAGDDFGCAGDRTSMDQAGAILVDFASGGGGVLLTGASLLPTTNAGIGVGVDDIFAPGQSPYARGAISGIITGGEMQITDLDSGTMGNQVPAVCNDMLSVGLIGDPPLIGPMDFYINNRAFRVGALDADNGAVECATFPDAGAPSGAVAINAAGRIAAFPADSADVTGVSGETSDLEFRTILANSTYVVCRDPSTPAPLDVPFDVRPGACPNPFNPDSQGKLPVAIMGTATLDVSQINRSTVALQGVALDTRFSNITNAGSPYLGGLSDPPAAGDCASGSGSDGIPDLSMKFDYAAVSNALRTTAGPLLKGEVRVLTITGKLLDGTDFTGQDVVRITSDAK